MRGARPLPSHHLGPLHTPRATPHSAGHWLCPPDHPQVCLNLSFNLNTTQIVKWFHHGRKCAPPRGRTQLMCAGRASGSLRPAWHLSGPEAIRHGYWWLWARDVGCSHTSAAGSSQHSTDAHHCTTTLLFVGTQAPQEHWSSSKHSTSLCHGDRRPCLTLVTRYIYMHEWKMQDHKETHPAEIVRMHFNCNVDFFPSLLNNH